MLWRRIIPSNFIDGWTITIPKKGNALDCTNYRTISILSHASKILLNIVKNRIKGEIELNLGEDQFGFMSGRESREAILALWLIAERRIEVNRKMYLTFILFCKVTAWSKIFATLIGTFPVCLLYTSRCV